MMNDAAILLLWLCLVTDKEHRLQMLSNCGFLQLAWISNSISVFRITETRIAEGATYERRTHPRVSNPGGGSAFERIQ